MNENDKLVISTLYDLLRELNLKLSSLDSKSIIDHYEKFIEMDLSSGKVCKFLVHSGARAHDLNELKEKIDTLYCEIQNYLLDKESK